jgi:hypothetical protein
MPRMAALCINMGFMLMHGINIDFMLMRGINMEKDRRPNIIEFMILPCCSNVNDCGFIAIPDPAGRIIINEA